MKTRFPAAALSLVLAGLMTATGCSTTQLAPDTDQRTFETPEAAVAALAEVAGSGNVPAIEAIFGAGSVDLLRSGDDVADHRRALEVKELIRQRVAFEELDEVAKAALLGPEAWPFPIPLVKTKKGWRFDTEAGREEIENRRIGLNELDTLATLHAIVDAQREYFAGHHAARRGVYARRVVSTKGKKDGLYWPTAEGEPMSPLGPFIAEATAEGYSTDNAKPKPFHGYYYRMLTAQGPHAPGGAMSYLDDKGDMARGFAMVAWPARYGSSGHMTFVVGEQGIVFQKDLGEDTSTVAEAVTVFEPDETWHPTGD